MNLTLLWPEWLLSGIFLVLLLKETFKPVKGTGTLLTRALLLGVAAVILALTFLGNRQGEAFSGLFTADPLSFFFKCLFSVILLAVIPMSHAFFKGRSEKIGEFYLILWTIFIALFFLVSANDFVLLFVALEIVTLAFYILAAYLKRELISIEAGLKYLILGSVASAFMLYGIALIYVVTGSTSLISVQTAYASGSPHWLLTLGTLMMISAVGFKIASVPFQLWVPDVYEGAPTPVVAFLSTGSKAAGFAILIRLLFTAFNGLEFSRALLFSIFAAMTLVYGNLGALKQTNIKRLFGYSSIGHAGYILIGIAASKGLGITAALYYLVAYAVTNLCAFLVITLVGKSENSDAIHAYRGLAKRSPLLAGTFFVALLSLAGVPPLAGFFGKFLVLLAAVQSGLGWLALLGSLFVAVSLFYYLSLVRVMYGEPAENNTPIQVHITIKTLLIALIIAIIFLGIFQAPLMSIIPAI